MRKPKRVISKTKTYGFNPWMDQLDAINQIIADTGEKESTVLRKLIDEALSARHRRIADQDLAEHSSADGAPDALRAIQKLLEELVRQGHTSLRMQDVSLALLQDTLAEARAGRELIWDERASALKDGGQTKKQISERFEAHTHRSRDFAYNMAKEIKSQQE
jgi:hypothetical protein